MAMYRIDVVDDEKMVREYVKNGMMLRANRGEYRIRTFASAEAAIEGMETETPDLVLLDIGLPKMGGLEALELIKSRDSQVLVIMITASEDIQNVIRAMKAGAYDYIVKPFSINDLQVSVKNALGTVGMKREIHSLQEKYLKENVPFFVSESEAIQDTLEMVEKVAQSPFTPVLIAGESGTGKELIARTIHYKSPNFNGPLVSVNCAAIPRDLIESELFGYERGAFSGAKTSGKAGLVESAAGGTLFLDEVGDLSLEAQAKLLRFLETGSFYKIGGTGEQTVSTRIVSATNKNLLEQVDKEAFRTDLYHRLAVVKIEIPALDLRREDIVPIARHFINEIARKLKKPITGMTAEAEAFLKTRRWPGNIRELKNVVEREILFTDGPVLTFSQAMKETRPAEKHPSETNKNGNSLPALTEGGLDLEAVLVEIQKTYFQKALEMANENESRAAKLLSMSRDTFRYRRKKLEL